MDYYLDTEFLEGTQKKRLFGVPYGETPNTIDLISIGIVAEDGREYYAISKDFNLKEAWNRHELKINKQFPVGPEYWKKYWIRENVLKPIFNELCEINDPCEEKGFINFTYTNFKILLSIYGKTNQEIADEIKRFVYNPESVRPLGTEELINFYAYYADYDWVVFCWLFGKMIDLPEGFPMYCRDLKQDFDFYNSNFKKRKDINAIPAKYNNMSDYKEHPKYPNQTHEHNALADAQWNKKLHDFLKSI